MKVRKQGTTECCNCWIGEHQQTDGLTDYFCGDCLRPVSIYGDIPNGQRYWCLDRRELVRPGDPACTDPNCDAHRPISLYMGDDGNGPVADAELRAAEDLT